MDEIWERAVITALEGQRDAASVRALTLDGAVKCLQGRLPPPSLLERFENIQHLSIANTGVSSLQHFPRLGNLQKLILSDNRIAGGLEFLVEAGLESLRDLDLSNNRIQHIEDLAPLAQLKLVSLDLYECPVTRAKDYRATVFGLVKSLKFLDKMDAEGSERLESDEEEEDEDEDEDEDEEYDPGSGEVDGDEDRPHKNGFNMGSEGIVDVDEDEESDADEEETDLSKRVGNGSSNHQANGFQVVPVDGGDEEDDEGEYDDSSSDSGEEIDEEDGDEDVAEVHGVEESDDGEFDAFEIDEDGEDDDEENDEVDNEEGDIPAPGMPVGSGSIEGVIDGHEHGEEEGAEDDNGETGEEEPLDDDGDFDEEEEEDYGAGYLVLPVGQAEEDGYADLENEAEDLEGEEVEDGQELPSSLHLKRKRGGNGHDNEDDDGDDDDSSDDDSEDDDIVDHMNSSKKQR